MTASITDHNSTPTTTAQLLDHLVEQGYSRSLGEEALEEASRLGLFTVSDLGVVEPVEWVFQGEAFELSRWLADHARLRTVMAERNATELPACPAWCSKPSGHLYRSEVGEVTRVHERDFIPAEREVGVQLSQQETVDHEGDGAVGFDGPHLYVDVPSNRGITSAEARRIAVALVEAADTLDGPR